MTQPKRIQRKRTKGWRMPEGAVYVGRPTKWGNPFSVAACIEAGFARDHAQAASVCWQAYNDWIRGGTSWEWPGSDELRRKTLADLGEIRGKDLACFCGIDQPCHADVLLELANRDLQDGAA